MRKREIGKILRLDDTKFLSRAKIDPQILIAYTFYVNFTNPLVISLANLTSKFSNPSESALFALNFLTLLIFTIDSFPVRQ